MRRIAIWVLALLLLATTMPSRVLADSAFGPTRDLYLPAQVESSGRSNYLDLETNHIANSWSGGDVYFQPGAGMGDYGQIGVASGQGISLLSSNYDSLPPSDTGVSYARTVPLQIGGAYLVRTRSGRLARLSPVEAIQDGKVMHVQYSVVGDTDQNPAGDSGTLIVTFNPMITISIGQMAKLDLEAGTLAMDYGRSDIQLTMTGSADNLVAATADLQLLSAKGVINEGLRGFDGLRQFPASGFLQTASGRALDLYLVKTRSGKYAKLLIDRNQTVVPYGSRGSDLPQTHNFVVRLATQQGDAQPVKADNGGLQSKTGVSLRTGQGLNAVTGSVTDQASGDIYLASGYVWASSTGAANIKDLGANTPDRIKTFAITDFSAGAVQALDGHTYGVKTRDGKYGLVYLSRRADGGLAVVDVYYQPNGTTTFFDFLSVDNGTDMSGGTLQVGKTNGYTNGGTFGNYGGGTSSTGSGSGTGTDSKTGVGSGALPGDTNHTGVGSGALNGSGRTVPVSDWIIKAELFQGKVYLNWNYPPGVDLSQVSGFFVFQGKTPADANSQLHDEPLRQLYYTVSGLPDGETTYFRVQVFDQQQNLGKTSAVLAVTTGANGSVSVVPGDTKAGGTDVTSGTSGSTNTGAVTPTSRKVRFQLGSKQMQVQGMDQLLAVPAQRVGTLGYVPFRALGDALGATVDYNDSLRIVSFALNGRTLQLFLNAPHNAVLNGTFIQLNDGPVLVDNHTLVPVRLVSEQLGAKVEWHEEDQSITIYSP